MEPKGVSRKEKRKALKKEKRKQIRKELAQIARAEEEARLNDPQLQQQIQLEEEREKERLERERHEFEERERIFLQQLQTKKNKEQQQEPVQAESKLQLLEGVEEGPNEDGEWEYVEEGPPEIIWQGNEIIVKKNKVRVKKKDMKEDMKEEDPNRPTSNPLPPQHEAYAAFKNAPMTSAELLDSVAQQVPNFGTEQDKAHCPFHIKTGACRFGLHCNRVHYYPDKSNTLLIKNMYNGPGLAWEQDEGLEYTEDEVECSYEEFYEDVHTEFLKFGEIINFKVCRNGSFHLRGNVYVQYKSLESAVMAYSSVHGRYFAGKQVKCEFVSLTRWKVAICGEYMKSRLQTCSRGSACNFLHCFSNPGGDYEWADCDKPPPRYWVKKMTALFGYSDEIDEPSPTDQQHSARIHKSDRDSYYYKRHQSVDSSQHNGSSSSYREETHARKSRRRERQEDDNAYEDETKYKYRQPKTDSDGDQLDRKRHGERSGNHSMHIRRESKSRDNHRRIPASRGSSSDEDLHTHAYTKRKSRHRKNISESSNDAKIEPSEGDLLRHKPHRSTRRRSRHNDRDQEDRQDSKKVEGHSRHRSARSRSHESPDKNEMSDRWQPESDLGDHSNNLDDKDCEISDDKKPKESRIDHETHSGSVVEDTSKEIRHSRGHDDRTREKRKRI